MIPKKSPILITLSRGIFLTFSCFLANEEHYNYEENLLQAASVYSTHIKKGIQLLPKPVLTGNNKIVATMAPTPIHLSPQNATRSPNCKEFIISHDQGPGLETEYDLNATKKIEGANLENTAENKFIIPNIRSILQSEEINSLNIPAKKYTKSVNITPSRIRLKQNLGIPKSMNISIISSQKGNSYSVNSRKQKLNKSVISEDQIDKSFVEKDLLRRQYKMELRKKDEIEQEYVSLLNKEGELQSNHEKNASQILSNETELTKNQRDKKLLTIKAHSIFHIIYKIKRHN